MQRRSSFSLKKLDQQKLTWHNHEELDAHDDKEKADKEDLGLVVLS